MSADRRRKLVDIMRGKDRSVAADLVRAGLDLAQPFYALAVALRNLAYDRRLPRRVSLPRPVISVGNLTTGGTGKTPMVIEVARRLQAMNLLPAVLLRGYRAPGRSSGRANPTGDADEVRLLKEALGPGVPVEADPDRLAAAGRVLDRPAASVNQGAGGVDVFVLDDGFQHRRVRRRLDIVLIDATDPFGGGLLPRGFLREPARSLRRAHFVVITRADLVPPPRIERLRQRIAAYARQPVRAEVAFRWTHYLDARNQPVPLHAPRSRGIAAACGIGNPAAFKRSLALHLERITGLYEFDDHHEYAPGEIRSLCEHARAAGAEALVTTEKDWVKWRSLLASDPSLTLDMEVYRPAIEPEFLSGSDALDTALRTAMQTA